MPKRGVYSLISVVQSVDTVVLNPNPQRTYLRVGNPPASTIYVGLGQSTGPGGVGFRLTSNAVDLELTYDEIGDLIHQAVHIFSNNAGAMTIALIEGMD